VAGAEEIGAVWANKIFTRRVDGERRKGVSGIPNRAIGCFWYARQGFRVDGYLVEVSGADPLGGWQHQGIQMGKKGDRQRAKRKAAKSCDRSSLLILK
jgi:hypothetical protein